MTDVAIVGGGPAGSTLGALLKKYAPALDVLILEKEVFPRDHVGESQLPPISRILDEMGCWDKVEAAGFPIKVGATYRWGSSPGLWDFFFVPPAKFRDEPRPAHYQGQRKMTAFQVERSLYDKILLDHAAELGCQVRQGARVTRVHSDGDRVEGLELGDGSGVRARHYVDASGNAAVLRKAMGVAVSEPAALRNIAVWDYWQNADWADTIGIGGTMVQVLSIPTGWIWFIPLSPTRTSIGFICPAEYYKSSGKSTEQLYREALPQDALIVSLLQNATREDKLQATKDWSFLSERMTGENWFLAGETAGFADPILAAGMTLAQMSAREAAYIILELDRGKHDPSWLKQHYETTQKERISQHIKFADFWYAGNGQFTDLKEHTAQIAAEAGLTLTPGQAFQWLGTGGFTDDVQGQAGLGGFNVTALKQITGFFADGDTSWELNRFNIFKLDLEGASETTIPMFQDGRIEICKCYVRDGRKLPVIGLYELMLDVLQRHSSIADIVNALKERLRRDTMGSPTAVFPFKLLLEVLEVMVGESWVKGAFDPSKARLQVSIPRSGEIIQVR